MMGVFLQIPTEIATSSSAADFTILFVKMLGVLGFVTLLAVFILKYFVPRMGFAKRFQKNRLFCIHGRFSLEAKKHLYVLEIGKRYFVIGTSESGIQKIAELGHHDIETSPETEK